MEGGREGERNMREEWGKRCMYMYMYTCMIQHNMSTGLCRACMGTHSSRLVLL